MDITPLLNAPWLQPLAGLLVTVLGNWLGVRGGNPTGAGISQHAVTHGKRASITQTVNQNTWHISEAKRTVHLAPQESLTAERSPDDDAGCAFGLVLTVAVGVSALTWAVASNWGAVSLFLRLAVLGAMFVNALTWWRWPSGVVGAPPLRVAITVVGSAVLWALTMLPRPVGSEPGLSAIDSATRELSIWASIEQTISMLRIEGIIAYELRLGGLTILLVLLGTMVGRGLGAVMAEFAVRHDPPRRGLLSFGNRLMGTARMGFGYFAGICLLCTIAVLIVHPDTVGWLLAHLPSSPVSLL